MWLTSNVFSRVTQQLRQDVIGRFDSGIWLITAINLLSSIGFSIGLPFLALYLHKERGLTMTLVGTMFLVAGLCAAATQLVGGAPSDRFGRRRVLLGATGISMLLYGRLAVLVGVTAPIWVILVVYIIARSMLAAAMPAFSAIVADPLTERPPDRDLRSSASGGKRRFYRWSRAGRISDDFPPLRLASRGDNSVMPSRLLSYPVLPPGVLSWNRRTGKPSQYALCGY